MKRFGVFALLLSSLYCYGQDTSSFKENCCIAGECCSAPQTPLGVMTDHIHAKGQLMVSYTYMNMVMRGSQVGTDRVGDEAVYKSYMMSPQSMTMQMHMVMAMYGITDRFTAMIMTSFSVNNMTMSMDNTMMTMPGMTMQMGAMNMATSSSGIADTRLYGLYNFSKSRGRRLIGSLGVSMPTGSIKATGVTMLGSDQRLPYNMQLGTGSFSLVPDVTYCNDKGRLAYGANVGADVKMNNNSLGYKTGNVYHATAWAAYQLLDAISCSIRPEVINAGKITGSDAAMDIPVYQAEDPAAKATNYGGTWVNVYAGVIAHLNTKALNAWALKGEFGLPVYQDLNGTQTSSRCNVLLGIQYSL